MDTIKARFEGYTLLNTVHAAFRAMQRNAIVEKIIGFKTRERNIMLVAHKFSTW